MFDKLRREHSRICKATERVDVADHCSNAAMTAWHLPELLWIDQICRNYPLRVALANEAGVAGKIGRGAFLEFVRSNGECPELRYCRIIATETKHFRHKTYDDDPDFSITVSAKPMGPSGDTTAVRPGGLTPLDWMPVYSSETPSWVYKIVSGGDRESAVDLFQRIIDYWVQFDDRHGIGLN